MLQIVAGKYFGKDYKTAITESQKVLDSQICSFEQKFEASLFQGSSYYRLNDKQNSEAIFEECIRLKPSYKCPEFNFGEKVCSFFDSLRSELLVSLQITSEPESAILFVNNEQVGTTPFKKDTVFADDVYEVILKSKCHKDIREQIKIAKGKPNSIHFQMEKLYCPIEISSIPSGAMVSIEGIKKDTTAWIGSVPCGGIQRVEISKKGYYKLIREVECLDSRPLNVLENLIQISRPSRTPALLSTAACALSIGSTLYFHKKTNDSYDRYMESTTIEDINKNWDDYESDKKKRRISSWSAGGLSLLSASLWLWYIWPRQGTIEASFEQTRDYSGDMRIEMIPGYEQVQLVVTKRF